MKFYIKFVLCKVNVHCINQKLKINFKNQKLGAKLLLGYALSKHMSQLQLVSDENIII